MKFKIDRFWMWFGLTLLNLYAYYIQPNTVSLVFMIFSAFNMFICYIFADAIKVMDEQIAKEKEAKKKEGK